MDQRMDEQRHVPSGVRHEVDPARQDQAALEQAIERTQDEVDAQAIAAEREPLEPEDALDRPSETRLFEMAARRHPRA